MHKLTNTTIVFPVKKESEKVKSVCLIIIKLGFGKGKWDGEKKESEEMKPRWFDVENIPFNKMWGDWYKPATSDF